MTWLLILICTGIYTWLWVRSFGDSLVVADFHREFGVCALDVRQAWHGFLVAKDPWAGYVLGDLWLEGIRPLFTYMFLHAGPVHLLANMLCLFVLGSRLESRASWWRFALFYVLCGVLAGVAQCLWTENPGATMVGSSGAIAGVIASYLVYAFKARILILVMPLPLFVEVPFAVLGVAWIILQFRPIREFLRIGEGRPVSYTAHLGGVAAGLLLAWLLWQRASKRVEPPRHLRENHGAEQTSPTSGEQPEIVV